MDGRNRVKSCAVFAVCLLLVETAHSLKCYQCVSTNSTRPFQCNEVLSDDIDMVPESCDGVFGATYCVKHTGRFEDGIGTKRFCSSVDRGNYCDYVNHKGDKLTYRTCIFTCTGDGCNPATTSTPSLMSWIIPFALLVGCRLHLQR